MNVVDRAQPKGLSADFRLAQVCDETGLGIFSVKEVGCAALKQNMQVIIRMHQTDGCAISCNCRFFWSFNLFCSHIFAVLNLLQIRTLEKFDPLSRWTKKFHASVYSDYQGEFDIENYAPDFHINPNHQPKLIGGKPD